MVVFVDGSINETVREDSTLRSTSCKAASLRLSGSQPEKDLPKAGSAKGCFLEGICRTAVPWCVATLVIG
eukprot:3559247-Amphidinium_carterae.1